MTVRIAKNSRWSLTFRVIAFSFLDLSRGDPSTDLSHHGNNLDATVFDTIRHDRYLASQVSCDLFAQVAPVTCSAVSRTDAFQYSTAEG